MKSSRVLPVGLVGVLAAVALTGCASSVQSEAADQARFAGDVKSDAPACPSTRPPFLSGKSGKLFDIQKALGNKEEQAKQKTAKFLDGVLPTPVEFTGIQELKAPEDDVRSKRVVDTVYQATLTYRPKCPVHADDLKQISSYIEGKMKGEKYTEAYIRYTPNPDTGEADGVVNQRWGKGPNDAIFTVTDRSVFYRVPTVTLQYEVFRDR